MRNLLDLRKEKKIMKNIIKSVIETSYCVVAGVGLFVVYLVGWGALENKLRPELSVDDEDEE